MFFFKKIKPTTSSRRHLLQLTNKNLNKNPILKNKIKGKRNNSGRNNSGKITVFHKGGGAKQKYRTINFTRKIFSLGIVCSIEHDPNRSAFIAAIYDKILKIFYYILAPKNLKIGDIIKSGSKVRPSLGSSLPISRISSGTRIYNVAPKLSKSGQFSRSAGTFSIIKENKGKYATIELSSGKEIKILSKCFASVGEVSNDCNFLTRLGKAGQSRWLNKRPTVRGVAMNPVDHPHGGGEGKKSGKGLTPWGKPTKRGKSKKF
jgi:large subunit ribosomal protein L2